MMEWLQILHVFSYIWMLTFKHLVCILQSKETQKLDTQEAPRKIGKEDLWQKEKYNIVLWRDKGKVEFED